MLINFVQMEGSCYGCCGRMDLMAPPPRLRQKLPKNLRSVPSRRRARGLPKVVSAGDNGAKFEEERFSLFFGVFQDRESEEQEREMIEGGGEAAPRKYWLLKITLPPRPIYVVPGMAEAAFVCPLFANLFACKRGL